MAKVVNTKKTTWRPPAAPAQAKAGKAKADATASPVRRSAKDYDAHPSIAMIADWIAGLKASTGKTLEQWLKVCRTDGPTEEKNLREWLKAEHKFGTNAASWIAERTIGKGLEDGDAELYLQHAPGYVAAMYSGGKEALWPAHDALEKLARSISPELKLCPAKTIVPIYREHVVAQIKPATRTRIDFGLALGDAKGQGRLIETGGYAKKDRITHKIEICRVDDVDAFVEKMLRRAWERDATKVKAGR